MGRKVWLDWSTTHTIDRHYAKETFFYGGPGGYDSEQAGRGTDTDSREKMSERERIELDLDITLHQIDDLIESASMIGISYSDLQDMDYRVYKYYSNGYISKTEDIINNVYGITKPIAAKMAQAVWGSKDFNKDIKEVKLRKPQNQYELERDRYIKMKKMYQQIASNKYEDVMNNTNKE